MRRLIFVWFLLSLSLLIGMLAIAAFWNGPAAFRLIGKHFGKRLLVYAGNLAVASYEAGGAPGFAEFDRRTRPTAETIGTLYDGEGTVLVTPPPADLDAFARRAMKLDDPEIEVIAGKARFAVTTRSASGRPYTFAFQAPANQLLWTLIDWPTWIARVIFVMGAGIMVSSWLASRLSMPLADLGEQTRRFASGNFGERFSTVGTTKVPEIESLSSDFNYMAERIESLIRSQRHLLHYVSHELRTPLTRMQLAITLAQNDPSQETLRRIAIEGDRLNDLIDQILRYSQLESAEQQLHPQPIDWADFLDSIAADASFEAEAHGKQVAITHVDGGRFQGDRDLLRSAFENVIRNAIRHSPAGSTVEIEQRAGNGCDILIHDCGPGIPEEQLHRVFEPFFRANTAKETGSKPTGYGIGLAIAQQVALLHGAELTARNRAGGGLTMRFRFSNAQSES